MQIVDNWTLVTGTVTAVAADGASFSVRVKTLAAVPGFPSLVSVSAGDVLDVGVPAGSQAPAVGASIALRVRKAAAQRHYAHPADL